MPNTTYSNITGDIQNTAPPSLNRVSRMGGRIRVATDNFEVTGTDIAAAGDIVKLVRLPTNAAIHSIGLASDDLDSGGAAITWNLGLFNESGTAEANDCYATSDPFSRAATTSLAEFRQGRKLDIDTIGDEIFTDGGSASDPNENWDLVLEVAAPPTTAATGTIAFRIEYTID